MFEIPTWTPAHAKPLTVARVSLVNLRDLVDANDLIIVGQIASTRSNSIEVVPNESAEGVVPGEKADVFGTISINPTEVLKGSGGGRVDIAFESAKQDPVPGNPNRQLVYTYDSLRKVQKSDGKFLDADKLPKTVVAFLAKNEGYYPDEAGTVVLDPVGFAVVERNGRLHFDENPFSGGNQQPTLNELRALVASK